MTELMLAIALIVLLLSLILPAVQSARETSRKTQCAANLGQLSLAIQGFDSAHKRLPKFDPKRDESFRSDESPHVPLLPLLDQSAIYAKLIPPNLVVSKRGSTIGASQSLLAQRIPVFRCPSDSGEGLNNYCYNQGSTIAAGFDTTDEEAKTKLGPFSRYLGSVQSLSEITDGLSNTAVVSERLSGSFDISRFDPRRDVWFSAVEQIALAGSPGSVSADWMIELCSSAIPTPGQFTVYTGETWAFGNYEGAWYNHVAGPNSRVPYCATFYPASTQQPMMMAKRGVFRASGLHVGGVNVALADGSVRHVANGLDLQVWRAYGTTCGGEAVSDF